MVDNGDNMVCTMRETEIRKSERRVNWAVLVSRRGHAKGTMRCFGCCRRLCAEEECQVARRHGSIDTGWGQLEIRRYPRNAM